MHPLYLIPADLNLLAVRDDLSPGRTSSVERVYVDTVDLALETSGRALQIKQSSRVLGAVLEALHNGKPLASSRLNIWPSATAELPAGHLKHVLTDALGVQPLAEVLALRSDLTGMVLAGARGRVLVERVTGRWAGETAWRPLTTRLSLVSRGRDDELLGAFRHWLERDQGISEVQVTRLQQARAELAHA